MNKKLIAYLNAQRRRFRPFVPILAGARLAERMVACVGALLGIALTALICRQALLVAPLGASAVLLFAVPSSPLAQPWPIIGGNVLSAFVGVAVARIVPDQILAVGFGVSLAIAAMSFARCLHPPGGAAALTAIIGGPEIAASGFVFPFVPVGLNSVLLVVLGLIFHRVARRAYPHASFIAPTNVHRTSDIPPQMRVGFRMEDIDKALEVLHETYDISAGDLEALLRQVEVQALLRSHGRLLCGEIMSRDVVTIGMQDDVELARVRLLNHNIRTLPVLDLQGKLSGTVGLREILNSTGHVGKSIAPASTASIVTPAISLISSLTDGVCHAVIVVDEEGLIEGVVTQTDLLSALAKLVSTTA
jgi:CBS domain-containing membrane protein